MSNDHIITPGLELPLISNSSLATRMLFQFKSFSLASHTKMLMAGMQTRDARVFNGVVSAVGMGMLSYWLWAQTAGERARKEMEDASFARWLDEGNARSGILASLGEVQRIAERVPVLAPYANFSGQRDTRRAGDNLTEALLGPSFDFASTAASIATGADDPTQSTIHQLRTLTPLQNVFYLRSGFDMLEQSLKTHFPKRRESQTKRKTNLELN
jgi:hypothetical protein